MWQDLWKYLTNEISAISYMKAMYNAKLVRMTIFIYVIKAIEMAHLFGASIWFEKKKKKRDTC